ncbi:MAG: hypothetical protein AAGK97_07215, partial [Bacteroidota bacterium]
MKKITYLLSILLLIACNTAPKHPIENKEEVQAIKKLPKTLQEGIEAHGGLKNWQSMKQMKYQFPKGDGFEEQIIDLQNRKVLINYDTYKVGFDGDDVWVSPNKDAFGKRSARFYHNLIFYFYAMPFVLADDGIVYTDMGKKTIQGNEYDGIKISYNDGVGDAPDDYYIALFNDENIMEWLMYTVTYYSKEKSEKYNILNYSDWEEVNGLLLPKTMKGYKYENDELGELRYERTFS